MKPLERYLLSNGNLAGVTAAALTAGLYLVGLIEHYWIALMAGAYVAGAVAFWQPAPTQLQGGLETQEYLTWLTTEVLPKLTGEAAASLSRILAMATEIWPRLKEMQEQGLVQVENRALLKQTLTQLLPDIVTSYLKLPTLYAKTHKVEGKTPAQLLVDQLVLLEEHVATIRDGVYAQQVDALLANGRYIQEKFNSSLRIS